MKCNVNNFSLLEICEQDMPVTCMLRVVFPRDPVFPNLFEWSFFCPVNYLFKFLCLLFRPCVLQSSAILVNVFLLVPEFCH